MTLTIPFPGRRTKPRRKHRADDRIAELEAQHAAELAELRAENVALLNMKAAADDAFVIQVQLIDDLEDDVRRLRKELADEQGAHAVADADVEARERWIRDLEVQVADLTRRLDVRKLAESAAEKTQEIDPRSLPERFATGPVLSLNHSPQAATDPAHVPSWAVRDDEPEPAA